MNPSRGPSNFQSLVSPFLTYFSAAQPFLSSLHSRTLTTHSLSLSLSFFVPSSTNLSWRHSPHPSSLHPRLPFHFTGAAATLRPNCRFLFSTPAAETLQRQPAFSPPPSRLDSTCDSIFFRLARPLSTSSLCLLCVVEPTSSLPPRYLSILRALPRRPRHAHNPSAQPNLREGSRPLSSSTCPLTVPYTRRRSAK